MVWLRRLALVGLALAARPAFADPPAHADRAFTVRVHDYAEIDDQQLRDAQREVAESYARCGVRAEWRVTVRPARVADGREQWPSDPEGALTLIVISEAMAARSGVPPEIAGYAATNRRTGGTIAFVVGDRTQAIARRARVSHGRVLASVIAHEIAHLLLPRAHGRRGVLRATWTPADFGSRRSSRFSPADVRRIRQSMAARSPESRPRVGD